METKDVEIIDLKAELQVFDPMAEQIAEMKEKNANLVFVYEDKDGNKEARSWIARLRKLKAPVTETHKLAKAQALKFTKALDAKKKELIGVVDDMIKVHQEPVWEIEQREIAIEAEKLAEELRVKEEEEAARLAEVEAREKAAADKEAELKAKQAEIERKEREKAIAEEAEQKAKDEAKQALVAAENAKVAAEAKAEQDAINATNAHKQALVDAENKRLADIARVKDEAAEKERTDRAYELELESQEQERQADKQHRSKIHRAIYKAMVRECTTIAPAYKAEAAKYITQALIDGKIPHVTIQY